LATVKKRVRISSAYNTSTSISHIFTFGAARSNNSSTSAAQCG
jgi:hypothetical protein